MDSKGRHRVQGSANEMCPKENVRITPTPLSKQLALSLHKHFVKSQITQTRKSTCSSPAHLAEGIAEDL